MQFTRLSIPDVILCKPQIYEDDRGYFYESFRQDKLEKFLGYRIPFCQNNESKSNFGILRGLHYQSPPFAQSKLVRVTKGSVLDVAVDIRKGSPSFGEHVAVELSSENKYQLLVPRGFAHGFIVLSQNAVFSYMVDNYYSAQSDRGIAFDDRNLNIDWKIEPDQIELSEKDRNQPSFEEAFHFDINEKFYE